MRFIERYFFSPTPLQKALALSLFPFTLLYCFIATTKRVLGRTICFPIPIISVGNLVLGGSGKTPFLIEIAKDYKKACVILRGVGRKSKGLVVVSEFGSIQCDTLASGDEAMLLAKSLPNASVIVSKNRKEGIKKALELQSEVVFLDDGFRFPFKKLNILLRPKLEPYFKLCIPSGGYREKPSLYTSADILATEGVEYERKVRLDNPTQRMLLLTAIANPSRLEEYLPNVVGKMILKDHSFFDKEAITQKFKELQATSLLVTQKDAVKLVDFGFPLSTLLLELQVKPEIKAKIKNYITQATT